VSLAKNGDSVKLDRVACAIERAAEAEIVKVVIWRGISG
jgi:hypothetical protein